jgi:hypothetical protein
MVSEPPRLKICVVTEDSSADAEKALICVLKVVFSRARQGFQTNLIDWQPALERALKAAASPSRWTGRDNHQARVALYKAIAERLKTGVWVLYHFDGDTTWENRANASNSKIFSEAVCPAIQDILGQRPTYRPEVTPVPTEDADRTLGRLIPMVPYYSIEAWYYQNSREAIKICRKRHRPSDVAGFEAWAAQRDRLDEIEQIAENCCLGKKYNYALAKTFSRQVLDDTCAVRKSLAAFVDSLVAHQELQTALGALA